MCRRNITGSFIFFYYCCTGAVSEKNTRPTVLPVRQPGQRFTSYDQNCLINPTFYVCQCCIVCQYKPGTCSIQIKTDCFVCTNGLLHFACATWNNDIRRNRGHQNQIQFFWQNSCIIKSSFCSFIRHGHGRLFHCNMASRNSGPFSDP